MSSRTRSVLYGLAVGAAIGALFGWIIGDADDNLPATTATKSSVAMLGPSDFVKIAISVLVLAREFSQMLRR
jgi:hypothetical protein